MMWAQLLHLGTHFAGDESLFGNKKGYERCTIYGGDYNELRCEKDEWVNLTNEMAKMGLNTVVIDLNEGVKFDSHPELAVNGSWTADEMRKEVARLKSIGLTPIPKLNFSSCHDEWMGEFQKMLSTKPYYDFCREIFDEVCDIFDKPQYFHIGMDEETYNHQRSYSYAVIRHKDLWWHDVHFYIDCLEKNNCAAWVWSDAIVRDVDEYVSKMPKTVLQSVWYYDRRFDYTEPNPEDYPFTYGYRYFPVLEEHGYKQVPMGTTWQAYENLQRLSKYCRENISKENFAGFMSGSWYPTIKDNHYVNMMNADLIRQIKEYDFGEY